MKYKQLFSLPLTSLAGLLLLLGLVFSTATPAYAKCASNEQEVAIAVNGSNCIKKGGNEKDNVLYVYLTAILKFLAATVGIAVVAGVAFGGIKYSLAQGQPGKQAEAVTTIVNAVLGLILYVLMFAILNFLIPGGILG
jgi:ACR3 family arsenite efflux pump ArsB